MNDHIINLIITEIAEELGMKRKDVVACVKHFFSWQYNAFVNMEAVSFLWSFFGVFTAFNRKGIKNPIPEIEVYNNNKKVKSKKDNKDEEQAKKTKD